MTEKVRRIKIEDKNIEEGRNYNLTKTYTN